jgi:predicted PurR-regulated permease PerM
VVMVGVEAEEAGVAAGEGPRPRLTALLLGADPEGRTTRLVRGAAGVWMAVGVALLAIAAWRLLWPVAAVVLPPLLLAALVVYALDPPVSWLGRRGLPRWAGTTLVYLAMIGLLAGSVALAAPMVGAQVAKLTDAAPDLQAQGGALLERGLGAIGIEITLAPTADGEEIAREVAEETQAALDDEAGRERLATALGGLAGAAAGTAKLLVLLALGPVLAFYLLADLPRVLAAMRRVVPPRHREEVAGLAVAVGRVTGGYVRGQLVVALFVGLAASLGLWLVGLPFWALIGAIAGITNIVPFVGPFMAGLLGIGVALLSDGWGLALWVLAVVVVVQQLESQVAQPLVMGRAVRLHPALVLLSLIAGGGLFGLVGVLLAVPAVAAGKVVALHLWERHVPWAEGTGYEDPGALGGVAVETVGGDD